MAEQAMASPSGAGTVRAGAGPASAGRAGAGTTGGGAAHAGVVSEVSVRFVGALLAVAVSVVHVADQGGVTAFNSPAWIGWGYRLIEVGGLLTALALVLPRPAWLRLGWLRSAWLGWAAAVLLGTGPFLAYIASRTVGVPGDPSDVGNWGYWLGTVSLIVEAALVVLSVGMLMALRQRSSSATRGPSGG